MKKKVLGDSDSFGSPDFLDQVAENVATTGERLTEVPLDRIREKENVRTTYENVETLAESIREEGLLQPVQAIRAEDGFFDLLIGHRRFRAYVLLSQKYPGEFTKIRAIVREAGTFSAKEIVVLQLAENLVREGLSPLELREALLKLREMGLTHKEIAHKIRKQESYVSQLFTTVNALNANPELENLLKADIGVSIGLADLQEVRPLSPKLQVQVIAEKARGDLKSREELRSRVRELKDGHFEAFREKRLESKGKPLLSVGEAGLLRLRAIVFDPRKSTPEARQNLVTALREALSRIEAMP